MTADIDGCTYFSAQLVFLRLPSDERWNIYIRTHDEAGSHEIVSSKGYGMLDEHVLGEHTDMLGAVAFHLAERMEGLSQKLPIPVE